MPRTDTESDSELSKCSSTNGSFEENDPELSTNEENDPDYDNNQEEEEYFKNPCDCNLCAMEKDEILVRNFECSDDDCKYGSCGVCKLLCRRDYCAICKSECNHDHDGCIIQSPESVDLGEDMTIVSKKVKYDQPFYEIESTINSILVRFWYMVDPSESWWKTNRKVFRAFEG